MVQAADPASVSFDHLDWELACDNTRTCRAAGYVPDGAERPISVLLTRKAGAAAPVTGQVQVIGLDTDNPPCPVQISLQGASTKNESIAVNRHDCTGVLSRAQVQFLLDTAKTESVATFAQGQRQWTLSLAGAQAVLLKMDEAQGRLDTPTALVRKGRRPASAVPPPSSPPVIRVPRLPPVLPQDAQRLPAIVPSLKALDQENNCPLLTHAEAKEASEAVSLEARLSQTQLLVSALCWRAAYNEGYGYWVVQDRPPHQAVLVTEMGRGYADGYANGEISYSHKGRGLGDCWGSGAWAWNGKAFVRSGEASTGKCRGFAGGAWRLPTYTSTVIHEN